MKWQIAAVLAATCVLRTDAATETAIVERAPHHNVVEITTGRILEDNSQEILHYTELANGLNYWDGAQWSPSVEEFEIIEGKAVARRGQQQLSLAADINEAAAVQLTLPEGQVLRSNPVGLSFYQKSTDRNVLIAEVVTSVGRLVAPNVVLFDNCFDTVKGAIRYTYNRGGWSQDVVLYEQVDPEDFGIPLNDCQLQLWTEFYDGPKPNAIHRDNRAIFDDRYIDFGGMMIAQGKAFSLDQPEDSIPVGKQWIKDGLRQYLVEMVDFPAIAPYLDRLPPQAKAGGADNRKVVLKRPTETRQRTLARLDRARDVEVASIMRGGSLPTNGFVLDYTTISTGQTDYQFRSDVTYYINADVTFSGTTTWEGGCVVKFAPSSSARIKCVGPVVWKGAPYRPVVLTARDDHGVGEKISSTSLSGYYASTALYLDSAAAGQSANIQYIRISHATTGIEINGGSSNVISHAQIVNCRAALKATSSTNALRNALLFKSSTNFFLSSSHVGGEHITSHNANYLSGLASGATLALTNSLLIAVTNQGTFTQNSVQSSSSASGIFATVGEGEHYLAEPSSYRNAGTTSINASLLADLAKLTTFAPGTLTTAITNPTTLWPRVERDSSFPDLGYHYPPIDWMAHMIDLSSTLVLTNGVVLGTRGTNTQHGIGLFAGAKIYSIGTPDVPNRLVRWNTVMEAANTSWSVDIAWAHTLRVLSSDHPRFTGQFRFTHSSIMGIQQYHIFDNGYHIFDPTGWTDCQFFAGRFVPTGLGVALTNCFWDRAHFSVWDGSGSPKRFVYNNLFRAGAIDLNWAVATNWYFKDNHIDRSTIVQAGTGSIFHDYNAYESGYNRITPNATNDVIYTNAFVYGSSHLGGFYQQSSHNQDKGSRNADVAGLSHHTTLTTQVKELSTAVGITKVTVVLNDLTHTWPDDIDILLVSPEGTTLLLMSDAGGGGDVTNIDLTFDDDASSSLPDSSTLTTGTYKPTNYGSGDSFDSPAPSSPYGATLAVFNTEDPNGTWKLYIMDDAAGDDGSIGSWTLNITTSASPSGFTGGSLTIPDSGAASPYPSDLSVSGMTGSGTTTVDIGFHYVATDGNGKPIDTDADGFADYFEDWNGDGSVDSGETDWNSATDLGLKVRITEPKDNSNIP